MLIHFDYDGVLVDSFDRLLGLAQMVQRAMGTGRLPRADDLRTIPDLTLHDLGRRIGIPEGRAGEFAARMFALLREDPPPVWSGIPAVLNNLYQNHILVVLTANAREAVLRTLARVGLNRCVREILDGETPGSKAEKLMSSRKRHGFAADRTLMIGDALSDLTAGRKAGVITVAVTWGFQPREKLADGDPDYLIDSPAEILKIAGS